jgi:hypothetical protein
MKIITCVNDGKSDMRIEILIIILILMSLSCSSSSLKQPTEIENSKKHLKSNLEFLASDELEGRESTKSGSKIAGQFIASRLEQYGVEPFGDENTYFQNLKLESINFNGSIAYLIGENGTGTLDYLKDYLVYDAGDNIKSSEIIYAGFGIIDSTLHINDYENLDVTGKTVLCLRGVPEDYEGPKKAGWTLSKFKFAIQQGAVGLIIILNNKSMEQWGELIEQQKRDKIVKTNTDKSINAILLDSLSIKNFFNKPDLSYKELRKELEEGLLLKKGTIVNKKITWELNKNKKEVSGRNVIAIIEGNDSNLTNEYVVVSAHYDLEGIINNEIYNGADDNASGTIAVLECARQLAREGTNKRSIIFCFWDAEEKGLLGSDFFAENYSNLKEIKTNINIDMVGREHADSIYVIGSGRLSSEFFNIVENANKKTSNFNLDYTFDDEDHPERFYYRSDHWNFAKNNIPVVFFFDGHREDYHEPSDDAEKINYQKISKIIQLVKQIVLNVANLDHELLIDNVNFVNKK